MRIRKIKVRQYRAKKRPHLKFVVSYREKGEGGERKRRCKFFETKEEAAAFVDLKNIELKNSGIEGAEFPTSLRVMAQESAKALSGYGKTIKDATDFYVRHLAASEKSCAAAQLVAELVAAKKADGAAQRHLNDLRSRLNVFAKKFDGQPVATITSAEIDDWLRWLNVSPVTRNH